jgi:hypothetical protein
MRKDNNERDRSIDRLLRRRLEPDAGLPAPATDACVDAETLAAWMDGSLSREALDRAEHHAAGCARCQAMLASMARTAPDTAGHPWWRSLTARWVVPIAAAATAAALWISVDRQQNPALPAAPPPAELSRTREPAAPPAMLADARERSAPVAQDKAAAAPSAKADAPTDTRAEQKSVPGRVAGGAVGGRTTDALRPSLQARSDNAASVASTAAATAAPAPPPPPAAPALPNAAPVPAAEPSVTSPLAETVRVIPESSAKAMRAGRAGESIARAGDAMAFAAGVEIVSPEPAFRWRLSAPAMIQRSTNGGVTWQPQAAPAGIVLTAGSSPARDVCWIVGRAGAVVLSIDGTAWQPRPFPEAVNLTAVRAIDAKNATVTTADGRQFSTTDGGATWSKLPL